MHRFPAFPLAKKPLNKSRATAQATETLIICSTFTWHFYASAGRPGNHRPAKHHPLGQISVKNHAESSSKLPYLLFRFKQHQQLSNIFKHSTSSILWDITSWRIATLHRTDLKHLTCWIGACSIINYIHELRWDDVTVSVTWYFTQRRHGLLKFQPSCCTTKPTMKALSIVISEANEDILTEK